MVKLLAKAPVKLRRKAAVKKSLEITDGRDPPRTLDVGGQRKEKLLKIAARRFSEFGFEATTIREIATDADILSGSVFYHFETKEEILHAIIRDAVQGMGENTIRIANANEDAEQRLAALTMWYFEELFGDQEVFAILYNERKYFRANPSFEYVFLAKANMYSAWKTVLSDGIATNLFRPDLDIFLTITTIIRMLNTSADWLRHDGEHETEAWRHSQDQVIWFNLDFILRAVRKPSRISKPVPRITGKRFPRAETGLPKQPGMRSQKRRDA